MSESTRAKWARYDARHADRRPDPPPPFDDLDLSAWSVALLRRHLDAGQFERMRGILARRVDDWLSRSGR